MSIYKYSAKDKDGHTVTGEIDGNNEPEVAEILHKKDLIVLSVEELKKKSARPAGRYARVKLDDMVIFSRQLATMIDAGIPLVQALRILCEQIDSKGLKGVVQIMSQDIEAGMSFSDSLAKHPNVFSELFINMAKAGEASGVLDEVLDRLAAYFEKTSALTRKIKASLVYPTIVVCMAIGITAFLLIKVVPTFKGIFEQLGGKLPVPTQILIGISDILSKYFVMVIIFLGFLGIIFKKYINTENPHGGNESTRIGRCISILDREIVHRFVNQTK